VIRSNRTKPQKQRRSSTEPHGLQDQSANGRIRPSRSSAILLHARQEFNTYTTKSLRYAEGDSSPGKQIHESPTADRPDIVRDHGWDLLERRVLLPAPGSSRCGGPHGGEEMLRWLAPLLPPVRRHEFPHAQEVIDRVLAGARRGRLGRVLSAPWSVVVRESISWWFSSATCHDRAASGDNAEEFTRIWLHRLHLGRIEAPKILLGPRNISPPLTCWNPPAQSRSGSSNLASWETSAHLSTIGNRRSFIVEIWKRRANYRYHTCNFRTSFLTGLACFRSCKLSCSSFASWVGFCISSVDELMRKKSHQVVNTFTTRS
jgi:hypothetical protein